MKRVRFSLDKNAPATVSDSAPGVRYGELEGDAIYVVEGFTSPTRTGEVIRLQEVRLLPPSSPSKIVCVGRNYQEHAREFNNPTPEEPLLFLKPPSSLAAHGDPVICPSISARVDFEGELGVIIGRRARRVPESQALDYVYGFTCVNDVTARDLQRKDVQFTRAKSFDTFCPTGPWLVTADAFSLSTARLRTYVNEELRQEAAAEEMIFSVSAIIAFVTRVMTLEPGDLIATGTPQGVGPATPGSVVRVEICGIGSLVNPFIAEP